ncbi:hypothetical protein BU15DRAFT_65299 [Melanogaster broomeanus]|nr:hypothetical protein BU15DRAFT_65299 [Melanogaster broomeanus]
MSTTQSPIVTRTRASSPSPTSTLGDASSSGTQSSALLFGFLVSMLTLFAVFMTSGIIWHHLVTRRRAMDATLRAGVASTTRALERPRMWEVWMISDKKLSQWSDAQPLAAETLESAADDAPPEAVPTISSWKRHLLRLVRRAPPEIAYLIHQPPHPPPLSLPPSSANTFPLDGSEVRVSVLISMPHRPHLPQITEEGEQKGHNGLHEIVFGTTSLLHQDSNPS